MSLSLANDGESGRGGNSGDAPVSGGMMKSSTQEESNDEYAQLTEKRKWNEEVESSRNIFKWRGVSTQSIIDKKNLREELCQNIVSLFCNNAIPFDVVKSDEFHKMLESIAKHGIGFNPPSYHDVRVKYLKQHYNLTMEAIEEHRANWKKTGCTIMVDGWTDQRRRTIINFLVNSPKGTVFLKSIDASHISKTADKLFEMIDDVVEEVGEENVVQVVTDNTSNYKVAGEMLMEKRTRLYWTPCVTHCIELMLEDFEKKILVHQDTIPKGKKITTYIYSRTSLISLFQHFTKGKDLVRPAMTHFATSYLTLGCLNDNRGALIRMFSSNEWKSSRFARTGKGKLIEDVVKDKGFWKNIVICLKGAYPLIKVLRLVNSNEKPMGFIYEEMHQAKEKIQSVFNGVQKSYMPLWDVIDERWDKQLCRPLHVTGYYLNPQLHYSPGFKENFEVKHGFYDCLQRIVGSFEERTKIDTQLENFKSQSKFFGSDFAEMAIKTKTPLGWWDSYGFEHPELQEFAIRVLSLTCSSFGGEQNRNAFEMVHKKRRNRLKQKTMNDVVFVMTNSKLAKKENAGKIIEYGIDDLSSDDDWIVDHDESLSNDEDLELDNLDLDTPNEEDSVQVREHGTGVVGASLNEPNGEDALHHF